MLYICIFSNKFDLNQTIRVSHNTVKKFQKWPFSNIGKSCKTVSNLIFPSAMKEFQMANQTKNGAIKSTIK